MRLRGPWGLLCLLYLNSGGGKCNSRQSIQLLHALLLIRAPKAFFPPGVSFCSPRCIPPRCAVQGHCRAPPGAPTQRCTDHTALRNHINSYLFQSKKHHLSLNEHSQSCSCSTAGPAGHHFPFLRGRRQQYIFLQDWWNDHSSFLLHVGAQYPLQVPLRFLYPVVGEMEITRHEEEQSTKVRHYLLAGS